MVETLNQDHKVKLDIFEGPLDLLLYLIKKNEVDIYDIPVSLISAQYIEYLELMKSLNLDIAGDFLYMAASLAHIKSQMLVPTPLPDEEEGAEKDPRSDLVQQLLEYQRYKEAATDLLSRDVLNRDVFKRTNAGNDLTRPPDSQRELKEISIFSLIDAFSKIIKTIPEDFPQEFYFERLTIRERITEIADILNSKQNRTAKFSELFKDAKNKSSVIVTFLALLEMIKVSLIRAVQGNFEGEILLCATDNLSTDMEFNDVIERSDQIDH